MKVLCITYREWAINIYEALPQLFPKMQFKIIRTKDEYNKDIITKFKP